MERQQPAELSWSAVDAPPRERGRDWFLSLWIGAGALAAAAAILGNAILSALVLSGTAAVSALARRPAREVRYAVARRGVRAGDTLYPWDALASFWIDLEGGGAKIILKSKKALVPLMVIPFPDDAEEAIRDALASRLPEEPLAEPFLYRLAEWAGV